MAFERALAEAVFAEAVRACEPGERVRAALAEPALAGWLGDHRIGLAVGKAALAMARGAGPVERGLVVSPIAGPVPAGWQVMVAAHPEPDERSVRASEAAVALVAGARPPARVLALISGGASALLELPRGELAELRATVHALMAAGAPIADLNAVRGALSAIKAGELAARAPVPVATLAISDVVGDDLAIIGSGPTIGPWLGAPGVPVELGAAREARRLRAREILARHGVPVPPVLDEPVAGTAPVTRADRAQLLAPMAAFAQAAHAALAAHGVHARYVATPLEGDVEPIADALAASADTLVAWGEPTLRVPEPHGQGGRAQQLALALARRLRGTERAALVIGSDGVDGPRPTGRPAPAGAFVDGATWDAISSAGIDPAAALARCDAGSALAAVGALVVTGPTGINHADLVILG